MLFERANVKHFQAWMYLLHWIGGGSGNLYRLLVEEMNQRWAACCLIP